MHKFGSKFSLQYNFFVNQSEYTYNDVKEIVNKSYSQDPDAISKLENLQAHVPFEFFLVNTNQYKKKLIESGEITNTHTTTKDLERIYSGKVLKDFMALSPTDSNKTILRFHNDILGMKKHISEYVRDRCKAAILKAVNEKHHKNFNGVTDINRVALTNDEFNEFVLTLFDVDIFPMQHRHLLVDEVLLQCNICLIPSHKSKSSFEK